MADSSNSRQAKTKKTQEQKAEIKTASPSWGYIYYTASMNIMQELLNIFLVLFVILKIVDLHALSAIDYAIIVLFVVNIVLYAVNLFRAKGGK